MKSKTKTEYQQYLNEMGDTISDDDWIMGGKKRKGRYGNALRRHDPIAFEVGYNDWVRELEFSDR